MANSYTSTDTGSLGNYLVQAAYDRYVEFALRAVPLIRDVADKRPVQQAMPGSSVVFQLYNDLQKAKSVLSETVDPDAVGFGNTTQVSVTLAEYGNAALATRKLELFSLSDVDPAIADIIAFNMADSIDDVAQDVLRQGPNVLYSTGSGSAPTSTATVGSGNTLGSKDIRKAVAKLRTNKAVPRVDDLYWCGIHPEVSHDLRAETGAGGWREAHVYNESGAGELWPGSIGTYEGAMFVESPRLYSAGDGATYGSAYTVSAATASTTNYATYVTYTVSTTPSTIQAGDFITVAGASNSNFNGTFVVDSVNSSAKTFTVINNGAAGGTTTFSSGTAQEQYKVYRTLVAGKQALAEAIAEEPHVVIGPVVDKLMRFRPIGWYGVLGFARYRDAALYRIESTSSIFTNN